MIDRYVLDCMDCFPGSFINHLGELIVEEKTNSYIVLDHVNDARELKAAVVEYASRAACKTEPYSKRKKNDELHVRVTNSINRYLGTSFSESDMWFIYDIFGNGVNHTKTLAFVDSGYDLFGFMNKEDEE